ncbi:MAG: phosphoglucomutase/phosphomannomutase family protein [Pyrinomonadaceae bacterium]
MSIKFGTSGWRAVIADEFTFANVRNVTEAICRYLKNEPGSRGRLIVGHDTRFMGEKFSDVAAEMIAAKGLKVLRCDHPVPTPTVAHAIRSLKTDGAMNFTASHNPPEYQGIKFSTPDGAPALPEVTNKIEAALGDADPVPDEDGGSIEDLDPRQAYLDDLATKINFDAIEKAGGKFVYDPLWGTGRGYLNKALADRGVSVETLHDWRDVTFGGQAPEPGEEHLSDLKAAIKSSEATLGLATDGDSDRFGVIAHDGTFITPNELIALLTDYLVETRGWKLGVARSVATSHLVDRVAKDRGIKVFETPVGFKYIGALINKDEIILGGEESAGLTIRGHYPEKDGILACLLAVEAVAVRQTPLVEQLKQLWSRVGRLYSGRIGIKLNDEVAAKLKEKLAEDPVEFAGRKVLSTDRIDGVQFRFENDTWILLRPSGTEPVVRIYAEAESEEDVSKLLEEGKKYLLG